MKLDPATDVRLFFCMMSLAATVPFVAIAQYGSRTAMVTACVLVAVALGFAIAALRSRSRFEAAQRTKTESESR